MFVHRLADVRASERNVATADWESTRMLLKDDGMGFSLHITTLYAGRELRLHYKNHLEAVFVMTGEGMVEDVATGKSHVLRFSGQACFTS